MWDCHGAAGREKLAIIWGGQARSLSESDDTARSISQQSLGPRRDHTGLHAEVRGDEYLGLHGQEKDKEMEGRLTFIEPRTLPILLYSVPSTVPSGIDLLSHFANRES